MFLYVHHVIAAIALPAKYNWFQDHTQIPLPVQMELWALGFLQNTHEMGTSMVIVVEFCRVSGKIQ